jgi:hypothetical protein
MTSPPLGNLTTDEKRISGYVLRAWKLRAENSTVFGQNSGNEGRKKGK